jgi:hypothetical protein
MLGESQAVDHEPRSRVREEKGAHDRLIRLALSRPEWALGFEDETWWSRFAQPSLHAFCEAGEPIHLIQQSATNDDPDPKALAAYGMLVRTREVSGEIREQVWLR